MTVMVIAPSASATKVAPRSPREGEVGVQFAFKKGGQNMTATLHPKTNLKKYQDALHPGIGPTWRVVGERGYGEMVAGMAKQRQALPA
jgi:hypothetical protein